MWRNNQISDAARPGAIHRASLEGVEPAPLGDDFPVVEKELILIPELRSPGGCVEKVKGLAILPEGTAWVSTDNDGVDDHSDETLFWSIGQL